MIKYFKHCKNIDYEYITDEFKEYLDDFDNVLIRKYISSRVIEQIKWYEKKCKVNKCWYNKLSLGSIIISATIPVLTLYSTDNSNSCIKLLIASLGSIITVISATLSLNNFKELWVQYRTNCEILKSILYRFFTSTGEFKDIIDEEKYDLLVELCEKYITDEFQRWTSIKITQSNNENMTT